MSELSDKIERNIWKGVEQNLISNNELIIHHFD